MPTGLAGVLQSVNLSLQGAVLILMLAVIGLLAVALVLNSARESFSVLGAQFDKLMDWENALLQGLEAPVRTEDEFPEEGPFPTSDAPVAPPTTASPPAQQAAAQVTADYRLALGIVALMVEAKAKQLDGLEDGKPFSFDRCRLAKLTNRWSDWKRAMLLLQSIGVGDNLTKRSGWKVHVETAHQGEALLRQYFTTQGFVWTAWGWLRK